jgi:hypothetical protein
MPTNKVKSAIRIRKSFFLMPEQSDGHPKNILRRNFPDADEQSEVGHPCLKKFKS